MAGFLINAVISGQLPEKGMPMPWYMWLAIAVLAVLVFFPVLFPEKKRFSPELTDMLAELDRKRQNSNNSSST